MFFLLYYLWLDGPSWYEEFSNVGEEFVSWVEKMRWGGVRVTKSESSHLGPDSRVGCIVGELLGGQACQWGILCAVAVFWIKADRYWCAIPQSNNSTMNFFWALLLPVLAVHSPLLAARSTSPLTISGIFRMMLSRTSPLRPIVSLLVYLRVIKSGNAVTKVILLKRGIISRPKLPSSLLIDDKDSVVMLREEPICHTVLTKL